MNQRRLVLNAFRPNTEIIDPAIFAGRKNEVSQLVDALMIDGSCPVIYGDRGLGKTSLALQLERIALGDVQLLQDLDLLDRILGESDHFVTVYLACADHMRTSRAIFQSLINEAESHATLDDLMLERSPVQREATRTLKLKFYEAQTKSTYTRDRATSYGSLNIDERLLAVLETLHIQCGKPVLLITDEIDRIENTSGLAGFIKNHCSEWLKVVLVGIAQNISTLLADHQSIERKIVPVRVNRMTKIELRDIIQKTEKQLNDADIHISFSSEACNQIGG
jgi:Cdc6-like AAA superfamily ATPase